MKKYFTPSTLYVDTYNMHFFKNQATTQVTCDLNILNGQELANAIVLGVNTCGRPTGPNEGRFCLDGPPLPLNSFQGLILRDTFGQQIVIADCNYGDEFDFISGCPGTEYTCTSVEDDFAGASNCLDIRCADGTILSQCPTECP